MRNFILMALLFSLMLLSGCFNYEETLVLNKDGSGTVQMKCAVSKAYIDQMKQMYEQMAEAMPDMEIPENPGDAIFNREDIEEAVRADNSGLELVHYEISETEDMKTWDMKFSFTDMESLDALDKALSPEEAGGGYQEEATGADDEPLLTKQDDGTWLFFRSFEDKMDSESYGGEDEEYYQEDYDDYEEQDYSEEDYSYDEDDTGALGAIAGQMEEGLNQVVEELGLMAEEMGKQKIRFSVTFPGKIIESNATSVDGNTAVWEYSMDQMENSPPDQQAIIDF